MSHRDRVPWPRAIASHLILAGLGATMLVPFLWMVLTAFKSDAEIFSGNLLPQATSLGDEGTPLATRDGRPLFSADGQPLLVRRGEPVMEGSKGDRVCTAGGQPISDDEGVPVLIGQVGGDTAEGVIVRFRDPRLMAKFAEPLLISRELSSPDNEALARRYFGRYDQYWETMLTTRWQGRVPLMATPALQDAWQERGGSPDAVTWQGRILPDPFSKDGEVPYAWRDCSWSEAGKPVRHQRRATALVDDQGRPLVRRPAFPVLRGPDDPLSDGHGPLAVRIGSADAPVTTITGHTVATCTHIRWVTSNLETVLADPAIKLSLFAWNSLFVSVLTVAVQLITSSLAAFAFARLQWPGRDRLFFCYLATLMVPGVVTQIPNYLILQKLGLLNTFAALVLPGAASAYGTFMLRQYLLTLPKGLEEAARIDGASWLRIWWDIALPLSKPALVTLAIFTFVGTWQSFAWPMIVCTDESVRLMPVALQSFADRQRSAYNLLMAGSLLMVIPTVLLFIFGQRYFVRGIQMGAVKG